MLFLFKEKKLSLQTKINHSLMKANFTDKDISYYGRVTSLQDINEAKAHHTLVLLGVSGKACVCIDRRHYTIEQDDILICAPHEQLRVDSYEGDFCCVCMTFSQHFMQALPMGNTAIWNQILYCDKVRHLKASERDLEIYKNYYTILSKKLNHLQDPVDANIFKLMINVALLEMGNEFRQKSKEEVHTITLGQKLLRRFIQEIAQTEVKRPPVSYYAKKLNVTPKYLTTACTRFSDKNASQWIHNAVLTEIQELMLNPDLSFKDISKKLGFPNLSSFSIFVKRNLHDSPTALRKKFVAGR